MNSVRLSLSLHQTMQMYCSQYWGDGFQKSNNTNWSLYWTTGMSQWMQVFCTIKLLWWGTCQKRQLIVHKMFWITPSISVVQWLAMGWTTEVYFSVGQEIVFWHSWVHSSYRVKFTIFLSSLLLLRMCVAVPPFLHVPSWHVAKLSTGATLPSTCICSKLVHLLDKLSLAGIHIVRL